MVERCKLIAQDVYRTRRGQSVNGECPVRKTEFGGGQGVQPTGNERSYEKMVLLMHALGLILRRLLLLVRFRSRAGVVCRADRRKEYRRTRRAGRMAENPVHGLGRAHRERKCARTEPAVCSRLQHRTRRALRSRRKTRFHCTCMTASAAGRCGRPAAANPNRNPTRREELSFAATGNPAEPLTDYQAHGITVALDGIDEVEGHKAYRLNVTLPSGASHHVWIDAKTFLDIKPDRASRDAHGPHEHSVGVLP